MFENIEIPEKVYTNSFTKNNAQRFFYLAAEYCNPIEDKTHGIEHAIDVVNRAFYILGKLGLLQFPDVCKPVYVAALFHDVGMVNGRKGHQHEGARIIRDLRVNLCNITFINVEFVIRAIKEHRASYTGEYTSIVSQVVSAADRKKCVAGEYTAYKTSYNHQRSLGYNHDESLEHAFYHINEKYGIDGYAYKNNSLFNYIYKDELEQYKLFIDNVMLNDLKMSIR